MPAGASLEPGVVPLAAEPITARLCHWGCITLTCNVARDSLGCGVLKLIFFHSATGFQTQGKNPTVEFKNCIYTHYRSLFQLGSKIEIKICTLIQRTVAFFTFRSQSLSDWSPQDASPPCAGQH